MRSVRQRVRLYCLAHCAYRLELSQETLYQILSSCVQRGVRVSNTRGSLLERLCVDGRVQLAR